MDDSWFVVQTKPRQEERAKEHLIAQGGEVYLPVYPKSVSSPDGARHSLKPLFPGYLFLLAGPDSALWGKIRSTRGVKGLLQFGSEPAKIRSELINDLKVRCEHVKERPLFLKNQRVRLASGPFRDYIAIFDQEDGDKRAVVLLHLLNQQQRLLVDLKELTAA